MTARFPRPALSPNPRGAGLLDKNHLRPAALRQVISQASQLHAARIMVRASVLTAQADAWNAAADQAQTILDSNPGSLTNNTRDAPKGTQQIPATWSLRNGDQEIQEDDRFGSLPGFIDWARHVSNARSTPAEYAAVAATNVKAPIPDAKPTVFTTVTAQVAIETQEVIDAANEELATPTGFGEGPLGYGNPQYAITVDLMSNPVVAAAAEAAVTAAAALEAGMERFLRGAESNSILADGESELFEFRQEATGTGAIDPLRTDATIGTSYFLDGLVSENPAPEASIETTTPTALFGR